MFIYILESSEFFIEGVSTSNLDCPLVSYVVFVAQPYAPGATGHKRGNEMYTYIITRRDKMIIRRPSRWNSVIKEREVRESFSRHFSLFSLFRVILFAIIPLRPEPTLFNKTTAEAV